MATRRGFVTGLLAAALAPKPTWADAGSPSWLAAARAGDGYDLCGLAGDGGEVFRIALPDRGHAAAAHPTRPDAVAFARRPGTFAVVFDCRTGAVRANLTSPPGRHFYGHGAYTADGGLLLTTENDIATGRGRVAVWDVAAGYARVDDLPSGGTGPHEILRLDDGGFVIANGGIETAPDSGRIKLNLGDMAPNLSYASAAGTLVETVELPEALHRHSIRHLATRPDGLVAVAMQWQGDGAVMPPLLGLHRRGQAMRLVQAPEAEHRLMQNYAGSIAFSDDGALVAITSPKGGRVQVFDPDAGEYVGSYVSADLCGVAAGPDGFAVSTGAGLILGLSGVTPLWRAAHGQEWDNHLVRVPVLA